MKQNIFLKEYFKIIQYLYRLNNIKYFSGTTLIYSWKSDGMSKENIEDITNSDGNLIDTA